MLIAITGRLDSGKSTMCRKLSERCKYQIYSTGAIHRNLAKRMGMDTLALNQMMSRDTSYDRAIDDEVQRIAMERRDERLIFDSRLAWHFVEKSLKLFTTVDPVVAAKRVFMTPRGEEEKYANLDDALRNLRLRAKLEQERFKGIYGVDYYDYSNFDLILDTTWLDPELLVTLILEELAKGLKDGPPKAEILISPKSLYPTEPATETIEVPEDHFRSKPLKVVCQDGYHFVADNQRALAAAQKAGLPYVYASIINTATSGVFSGLDPDLITQAQARGGFTYASLPDAYQIKP